MDTATGFKPAPIPTRLIGVGNSKISSDEKSWDGILCDGQSVLIRNIRADDMERERRFIERLSPSSRRFRFLGTLVSPSDNLLRQLVVLNPAQNVALIALIGDGSNQLEIGVARLSMEADDTCEFAVTVSDEWQNRGLGTLLMQHLICSAIERGIKSMHSIDAVDNEPMREFAAHLGFKRDADPDDATRVIHSLDLSAESAQRLAKTI